jgi:hypothetical protein
LRPNSGLYAAARGTRVSGEYQAREVATLQEQRRIPRIVERILSAVSAGKPLHWLRIGPRRTHGALYAKQFRLPFVQRVEPYKVGQRDVGLAVVHHRAQAATALLEVAGSPEGIPRAVVAAAACAASLRPNR